MAARRKAPAAALVASCDDVEAQFYEAMQQGDLERLMAVWADDDEVVCVHPGGPRVVGAAAIRATFESIFTNAAVPVVPTSVRRVDTGTCVVHNVLERIDVKTAEGTQTGWVIATNVYVKTVHGWRMVAHHASPGGSEAPTDIEASSSLLH